MSKHRAPERPSDEQPWSVPVVVAELAETERRVDLSADEATRGAIAKAAGVVAVPRLDASFELARYGRDGAHVTGRVAATVVQSCIVTLEPIESQIEEAVDLVFLPPREAKPEVRRPTDDFDDDDDADEYVEAKFDADLAVDTKDPPEELHNGALDLGAVAVEFLLLGIDPYPRKPDAVFDAPPAGDPEAHPFAALAALKKPGDGSKNG